jgi:hypothetical protein
LNDWLVLGSKCRAEAQVGYLTEIDVLWYCFKSVEAIQVRHC